MNKLTRITESELDRIDAGFSCLQALDSGAHWGIDNLRNISVVITGAEKECDNMQRDLKAFTTRQVNGIRNSILKKVPNNGWLGKFIHNTL